jgi:hypothetical protein
MPTMLNQEMGSERRTFPWIQLELELERSEPVDIRSLKMVA